MSKHHPAQLAAVALLGLGMEAPIAFCHDLDRDRDSYGRGQSWGRSKRQKSTHRWECKRKKVAKRRARRKASKRAKRAQR